MSNLATVVTTDKHWDEPEKTRESGRQPEPGEIISHTGRGETRMQDVRLVTPLYKSGPVPNVPRATGVGVHLTSESRIEPTYHDVPDYRLEKEKESYNLRIIDPRVDRLHSPPLRAEALAAHYKTPDFPSTHSHRSFLKMGALEPRRAKSSLSSASIAYSSLPRSISSSDYLSQSLERHRRINMSPLKNNLRVNERDVTEAWNPMAHPGPKKRTPLDLTRSASFSPKSIVNVNGYPTKFRPRSPELLMPKARPKPVLGPPRPAPPPPAPPPPPVPVMPVLVPVTYELKEEKRAEVRATRRVYVDDGYRGPPTIIKVKDETIRRPKKTTKKRIVKEFEQERFREESRGMTPPPRTVQTTDRVEECKRVEEVKRQVRSSRGGGGGRRHNRRSHSTGRGLTFNDDDYYSADRRGGGRFAEDRGGYHRSERIARDCYCPEYSSDHYGRVRSQRGGDDAVVEFPPTLPRSEYSSNYATTGRADQRYSKVCRFDDEQTTRHGQLQQPPARGRRFDWSLEPRCYMDSWLAEKNYGNAATGLERDFREASLEPMPRGQNVHRREFREEQIPRGHETLRKETKAQSGSKGPNSTFSECRQEMHFNREQELDDYDARIR